VTRPFLHPGRTDVACSMPELAPSLMPWMHTAWVWTWSQSHTNRCCTGRFPSSRVRHVATTTCSIDRATTVAYYSHQGIRCLPPSPSVYQKGKQSRPQVTYKPSSAHTALPGASRTPHETASSTAAATIITGSLSAGHAHTAVIPLGTANPRAPALTLCGPAPRASGAALPPAEPFSEHPYCAPVQQSR
jgi:hypothetical protein